MPVTSLPDLLARWAPLAALCARAEQIGELEIWAFGSMLRSAAPRDIDVLVVYRDPARLRELTESEPWELRFPPVDLIGMMPDEVSELNFLEVTSAVRLL